MIDMDNRRDVKATFSFVKPKVIEAWRRLVFGACGHPLDSDRIELVRLLPIAAKRLAAVRGSIWLSYDSGADLAKFVSGCRVRIDQGTLESDRARELWCIFAPTCDWDDVVGDVQLGDKIFTLLDKLYGPRTEKTA